MLADESAAAWRPTFAAMAALLIGIGLARFAYTPLIPALIAAHWFTPAAADYLGAANLAGYLLGAIVARAIAVRCGAPTALRAAMAVATASFFACAVPWSFAWVFLWRFAAGLAGAVLMVLAAPLVLPHVPPNRRGLAGGIILTGVGLGIAASGTLVPLLLRAGLVTAWCGLGTVALALAIFAWNGWPAPAAPAAARTVRPVLAPALMWIAVEYALNAAGLVPHMLFLVDFIARGLGAGLAAGAGYWVLFGIGALGGPALLGRIADRIGFAMAIRAAYLLQALFVGALAVSTERWVLVASSVVIGAFVPGITTLVLGRVRELAPPEIGAQQAAWSLATAAFAVGQAGAAYGFAYLFARSGGYGPLFALGAAALTGALILDIAVTRPPSPPRPQSPDRPRPS